MIDNKLFDGRSALVYTRTMHKQIGLLVDPDYIRVIGLEVSRDIRGS